MTQRFNHKLFRIKSQVPNPRSPILSLNYRPNFGKQHLTQNQLETLLTFKSTKIKENQTITEDNTGDRLNSYETTIYTNKADTETCTYMPNWASLR